MNTQKLDTKAGFVALIGATNAGKSTLLNQIMKTKVSIVSHKVQTTRSHIRGIKIINNAQIVFVDTPGIFKSRNRFDGAMVNAAWGAVTDCEVIVFILDAKKGYTKTTEKIITKLKEELSDGENKGKPVLLVLNKVDTVKRDTLLDLSYECNRHGIFTDTFMISALNNDGVNTLENKLADLMPESPYMYDEDQSMDLPKKLFAAEITREKIYKYLHQELPYDIAIDTEKWEEDDKNLTINQIIYVGQDSQKKIVLGKGGSQIKKIGSESREELSELLGKRVSLFLFVKVNKKWKDRKEFFDMMGLDFNA